MTHKKEGKHKGLVYAGIIGLVLVAHILISSAALFISYPTEAHRSTARELDTLNWTMLDGETFMMVMESDEYKTVSERKEARYSAVAATYMIVFEVVASIAIVGSVYHYLRWRRITAHAVRDTTVLVSAGQFLPLVLASFGSALYLGTTMPDFDSIYFMVPTGIIIAPVAVMFVVYLFDKRYNRKHSFVIE